MAEDIGPSRFEYPAQESDWRDGLYFRRDGGDNNRSQSNTGQGVSRQQLVDYLTNVENVPREQLIQDIESLGFIHRGGSNNGEFKSFADKFGKIRVEIHGPHPGKNGAKYDHLHIFDKYGNSLDKNLKVINKKSADAHIEIQNLQHAKTRSRKQ